VWFTKVGGNEQVVGVALVIIGVTVSITGGGAKTASWGVLPEK
jgi:hypothetical protein